MKRTAFLVSSLLVMMVLLIPNLAWAQADGDAYRAYYAEENPAQRLVLGEKFLADFKTSQYTESVYRQVVQGYYKANNFPKVLAWADKVEEYAKEATPPQKAQIYSFGMDAAQRANNPTQTVAFAEKVLSILPDDLNALITASSTLANASPQDKAAQDKAANYATKGLAVLEKMNPKDLNLSDADWAKQKPGIAGTLHSTVGSIHFNKGNYDKAAESLTEATKVTPKDGVAWYLLGLSINQEAQVAIKKAVTATEQTNTLIKSRANTLEIEEARATSEALQEMARGKRDQAVDALATSVACGGQTAPQAKAQLEKVYAQKNNGSMDGLDQLIKEKESWVKTQP